MGQDFIQEMEVLLYQMKRDIIEKLVSENENIEDLLRNRDTKDVVDSASDDADSVVLDALSKKDLARLEQIDDAISKISFGTYGKCSRCGEKIDTERLKALPYAKVCMKCKLELEKSK